MSGPKILIQSFFSGVIRCGGIATRLVSDFRVVCRAEAGNGGKAGAEDSGTSSVSIIKSSSSSPSGKFVGMFDSAVSSGISAESMSSSASIGSTTSTAPGVWAGFFDCLLRFLRTEGGELAIAIKATIFYEIYDGEVADEVGRKRLEEKLIVPQQIPHCLLLNTSAIVTLVSKSQ